MAFLTDLWLPILLSAVAVFFISSVIHMALKYHLKDYAQVPDEEGMLAPMRDGKIPPGSYVFPYCVDFKEFQEEPMQKKLREGPVGFMTIRGNGDWNMGKSLVQWFVFCVVLGVFIAYASSLALVSGDDFGRVFRVVSTIAFLAYAGCAPADSIWKAQSWATTCRFLFDGLMYGLGTGAVFAWLWPGA